MLENLNGLQMLVIGMTTGVIGSFLIISTYHMMGRKAAKERLAEFFDRYGILKGFDYYKKVAGQIEDDGVRARLVAETDRYLALIREEEKILDAIVASDPSQTR